MSATGAPEGEAMNSRGAKRGGATLDFKSHSLARGAREALGP